jgi:hypothetical protein
MLCGGSADVTQRQLQVAVFRNFESEPSISETCALMREKDQSEYG